MVHLRSHFRRIDLYRKIAIESQSTAQPLVEEKTQQVAMVQNNIFSRDELIKCGQGELPGAGVPLPLPDMLMVDRVIKINRELGIYGKGEIVGELDINPDLWFFQCHFKNDPIVPGTLMIDALFQLMGCYLGWRGHVGKGRAISCEKIKFKKEVSTDADKLVYFVSIKRIRKSGTIIAVADGSVVSGEDVVCTAKNLTLTLA